VVVATKALDLLSSLAGFLLLDRGALTLGGLLVNCCYNLIDFLQLLDGGATVRVAAVRQGVLCCPLRFLLSLLLLLLFFLPSLPAPACPWS